MQMPTLNEHKMNTFPSKVVGDFGAAVNPRRYIGQKLGLYRAMAD